MVATVSQDRPDDVFCYLRQVPPLSVTADWVFSFSLFLQILVVTDQHTFSGNFPTLVPPNFCTTHPFGLLFLATDFMLASPI